MAFQNDWPVTKDGHAYDGLQLLTMVRGGQSPFDGVRDVNVLVEEVERSLNTEVVDIPMIYKGSNNYGFHFMLSNRPDVVVRLARGDVNMPGFDGFPLRRQVADVESKAHTYELLRHEPGVLNSNLLHYRAPVHNAQPGVEVPKDIRDRRLLIFEKADGMNNVWRVLSPEQKASLLAQLANIRAALFNYSLPPDFATRHLRERLFEQTPKMLSHPVAPTRDFCVGLFVSKIEATIGDVGDMIGWESDNEVVGPVAFAAKQSILRAIPHIMPAENSRNFSIDLYWNMAISAYTTLPSPWGSRDNLM